MAAKSNQHASTDCQESDRDDRVAGHAIDSGKPQTKNLGESASATRQSRLAFPMQHPRQVVPAIAPSEKDSASAATTTKLQFSEVCCDLFKHSRSASLAHCVSEDLHMGKGIATVFKREFGGVEELRAQGVSPGGVAVLNRNGRFIYYLVTKQRYFHKPTYASLRSSLEALCSHVVERAVAELYMPRIGCGLDRLSWDRVAVMIRDIFANVDVKITICYL